MDKNSRIQYVDVLKAAAAIIIINSHFDVLYPVSALATGGAIGNGIFFAVSGFLLYPINKSLIAWIKPKLLRIYIPTLLMICVSLATTKKGNIEEFGLFQTFIWPTTYWFVGAIVLFYFLYYLLKNCITGSQFCVLFIVLISFYIIYYSALLDTSTWVVESAGLYNKEGYFKLIYYFAIMMLGKWLRINRNKCRQEKNTIYIIGAVMSFVVLYGMKFFMDLHQQLMHLQFLNQLCVFFFVFFIFRFCMSSKTLQFREDSKVYLLIRKLGNLTLPMYLVQFVAIDISRVIVFPANIIVATILIIMFASVLDRITKKIINLWEYK